ncbi:MAG: hypothetical protein RBR35_13620 [Salinivirgaceae bacterium]|nr:hypothetical protein [Salinivirgaceae bacterium]
MKFKKEVNIFELLSFLALVIGGIFSWFMINKYEAEQTKKNTELLNIEYEIKKLNLKYLEIEKSFNEKNQKVNFTIDLNNFLIQVRPSVELNIADRFEYLNNAYRLIFKLKNTGAHPVKFKNIIFFLSEKDFVNENDSALIQGKDYNFEPYSLDQILPGQTLDHTVKVKMIKNISKNEKIFYQIKYEVETLPYIRKLSNDILATTPFFEGNMSYLYEYAISIRGYLKLK